MSTYDPDTSVEVPPVPHEGAPEEPVVSVTAITALVTVAITLAVALGAPIDDDTQTAILAVVAVLAPIVLGWLARRKVWAPASVARVVAMERQRAVQGRPTNG